MDRIINSHIDEIDKIEEAIDAIIISETKKIKIEEVIANPAEALAAVVEKIKRIFLDEYANQAVELGINFGKVVNKKIDNDNVLKFDRKPQ